jgi:hypothetical protein
MQYAVGGAKRGVDGNQLAVGGGQFYGPLYVCHSATQWRNLHNLRWLLYKSAKRGSADSYGMTNVERQT